MRYLYVIVLGMACLLGGCGHSDTFEVSGVVEGNASINLRIVYTNGGSPTVAVTAATDGKFAFSGNSDKPALVEIYDNDYRLMGRFMAVNGEDIELVLPRSNPYSIAVKGNELSQRWVAYLNEKEPIFNSKDVEARNRAVADYVTAHPDDEVSTLLIMTEFVTSGDRAVQADSLMALISEAARMPAITSGYATLLQRVSSATSHKPIKHIPYLAPKNTPKILYPEDKDLSFIAFTDNAARDSVLKVIRRVAERQRGRRLGVYDLSVDPDTLVWSRTIRRDSADWVQGWVAGSVSGPALYELGIPEIPYFIITDSAGVSLWRGSEASKAEEFINNRIKE